MQHSLSAQEERVEDFVGAKFELQHHNWVQWSETGYHGSSFRPCDLKLYLIKKQLAWWSSIPSTTDHHYFLFAFTRLPRICWRVNMLVALLISMKAAPTNHCSALFDCMQMLPSGVAVTCAHERMNRCARRANVESPLDLTESSRNLHTHGEYIIKPLPLHEPPPDAMCVNFRRSWNATLSTTNDSHFLSLCAPSSVPCFSTQFILLMLFRLEFDAMLSFFSPGPWNSSRSVSFIIPISAFSWSDCLGQGATQLAGAMSSDLTTRQQLFETKSRRNLGHERDREDFAMQQRSAEWKLMAIKNR